MSTSPHKTNKKNKNNPNFILIRQKILINLKMAAADKPLNDEDLISYIVGGLNSSYHGFIMTFNFWLPVTSLFPFLTFKTSCCMSIIYWMFIRKVSPLKPPIWLSLPRNHVLLHVTRSPSLPNNAAEATNATFKVLKHFFNCIKASHSGHLSPLNLLRLCVVII
jgi:hypothetical protein